MMTRGQSDTRQEQEKNESTRHAGKLRQSCRAREIEEGEKERKKSDRSRGQRRKGEVERQRRRGEERGVCSREMGSQ